MIVSSFYDFGNAIQLAWIYKEDFTLNKTCAVMLRGNNLSNKYKLIEGIKEKNNKNLMLRN